MIKNFLALVGLVTVVRLGINFYDKHLKDPLEEALNEAFDKETK